MELGLERPAAVGCEPWVRAYQCQVGFGDSPFLEALISAACSCFIQGHTQCPAGGEVQLVAEPGKGQNSGWTLWCSG